MTKPSTLLTRRTFLKAVAASSCLESCSARTSRAADDNAIRFGLLTDVHYADAPTRGSRHYRDSMEKLRLAIETFRKKKVAFVVELGDFIDAGSTKAHEREHLASIRRTFETFPGPRHFVLGNHCLDAMTKDAFLIQCGATSKRSYYSFDLASFHFVILDANFRRDETPYAAGNFNWTDAWIPHDEQIWLADDLKRAKDKTTCLFLHQNLNDEKKAVGVKNASSVRKILESAGNVAAVFQGHEHSGGFAQIGGIDYVTLKAMVEGPGMTNNAFSIIRLEPSGRFHIEGFGRQNDLMSTQR